MDDVSGVKRVRSGEAGGVLDRGDNLAAREGEEGVQARATESGERAGSLWGGGKVFEGSSTDEGADAAVGRPAESATSGGAICREQGSMRAKDRPE